MVRVSANSLLLKAPNLEGSSAVNAEANMSIARKLGSTAPAGRTSEPDAASDFRSILSGQFAGTVSFPDDALASFASQAANAVADTAATPSETDGPHRALSAASSASGTGLP